MCCRGSIVEEGEGGTGRLNGREEERDKERQLKSVSVTRFANCPVAFTKTQFAGQSRACDLNKERDYHNYSLLRYNREHFVRLVHVFLKL